METVTSHPLRVIKYRCGPLDNNTYIIADEAASEAVLIDPSFQSEPLWGVIQSHGWRIREILNTHAHIDHITENALFQELTGAPIGMHQDDLPTLEAMPMQAGWMGIEPPLTPEPSHWLEAGELILIGAGKLEVRLTPGHSPGSVSFVGPGFVISGDALFAGSVGR